MIDNKNDGITDELINDILKNVKLTCNILDNSKDTLLTMYIKAVCTNILIATNRRVFIPEMKYLVTDLVISKYTSNDLGNNDNLQSIQSMSEAGRSVNFGVSNVITNKLNLLAQKQLQDNTNLVNKFKLLYKI